jgi:mycoredoxin
MNDTKQPTVIIYSTNWCGYCKMAMHYLDQKNVPYIDKNVETDAEAFHEFSAKMGGHSGVPVLDINGTLILGFDRPKIDAALAA